MDLFSFTCWRVLGEGLEDPSLALSLESIKTEESFSSSFCANSMDFNSLLFMESDFIEILFAFLRSISFSALMGPMSLLLGDDG